MANTSPHIPPSPPEAEPAPPQPQTAAPERKSLSPAKITAIIVVTLTLIALGFSAFNTVHELTAQLCQPPQNTRGEAGKVYYAKLAMNGQAPFRTATEPPFYPAIHGPLMHGIVGVLGRVANATILELYFYGRAISLLSTIGALALAWVLARRMKVHWAVAGAGLLLILGPTEMVRHGISFRPDNWLLLLSMAACYFVAVHGQKRWGLAIASVLPVIAFYVKAPGLGAAGAVVLALWLQRRWLAGLICGASSAALAVISFLIVNWLSSGMFLQGIREGVGGVPFSLSYVYMMVGYNYYMWIPLLGPILLLGVKWSGEQDGDDDQTTTQTRRAVQAFWAMTLLVACTSATRHGANLYYFLEAYTFGTLLLAGAASAAIRHWSTIPGEARSAMLLLLVLTGLTQLPEIERGVKTGAMYVPSDTVQSAVGVAEAETSFARLDAQWDRYRIRVEIAERCNQNDLLCYTNVPSLNVMLDNPQVISPILQVMLHRNGLVSDEDYIEAVRAERYDVIVFDGRRFAHQGVVAPSDEFLQAMAEHYPARIQRGRYMLFQPIRSIPEQYRRSIPSPNPATQPPPPR